MNSRLVCASIFIGLAMTSNPAFAVGDPELKRENFPARATTTTTC